MTAPSQRFDPAASALSAIENAGRVPVRRGHLRALLAAGEGEPSHFDDADLVRAYARARTTAAAANADLDEYAQPFGY